MCHANPDDSALVHLYQEARGTETPQERIKRLMAAQLNKRIADEVVSDAKRRLAQEKELAARMTVGRVLRCAWARVLLYMTVQLVYATTAHARNTVVGHPALTVVEDGEQLVDGLCVQGQAVPLLREKSHLETLSVSRDYCVAVTIIFLMV